MAPLVSDLRAVVCDQFGVILTPSTGDNIRRLQIKGLFNAMRMSVDEINPWEAFKKGEIKEEEFWDLTRHYLNYDVDFMKIREKILRRCKINEHVVEIIRKIKNMGYVMILFSDVPKEWDDFLKGKFNITEKIFDYRVTSYETGLTKDGDEMYKYLVDLLQERGISPQQSIFIDDQMDNIERAERHKLTCIHYRNPVQIKEELSDFGVDVDKNLIYVITAASNTGKTTAIRKLIEEENINDVIVVAGDPLREGARTTLKFFLKHHFTPELRRDYEMLIKSSYQIRGEDRRLYSELYWGLISSSLKNITENKNKFITVDSVVFPISEDNSIDKTIFLDISREEHEKRIRRRSEVVPHRRKQLSHISDILVHQRQLSKEAKIKGYKTFNTHSPLETLYIGRKSSNSTKSSRTLCLEPSTVIDHLIKRHKIDLDNLQLKELEGLVRLSFWERIINEKIIYDDE